MTTAETVTIAGEKVYVAASEGAPLNSEADAMDLMSEAFSNNARLVALPVSRLDPEFWRLSSRVLGLFAQKFANYHVRLAILGDMTDKVASSEALRDFIRETNRGPMLWFLPDLAALEHKLGGN